MISWYTAALMALVLMGIQRFFYKVAAERGYPTDWVTFSFMAFVTLASCGAYVAQGHQVSGVGFLMAVSFVNSVSFLVATVSHMEALKYVPANIAYTIIRLNVVVAAVFSILYFKERISYYQGAGLMIAIVAMVLLATQVAKKSAGQHRQHRGAIFVILALIGGAAASISSKFAAMHADKFAFMAVSYFMGMIGSMGISRVVPGKQMKGRRFGALRLGVLMGAFNFAGFYLFLYALERGPLSMIAAIVGMHFVVAVLLSALVYREEIKPTALAGIALTVISILLIRL